MTGEIRIEGLEDLAKGLTDLGRKQIPFALAKSLTKTAQDAQGFLTLNLPVYLDRPTPYIMRSFRIKPAKKKDLMAEVAVKDAATRFLTPQIEGGRRPYKPMEDLMARAGVLPPGDYLVPARGVKLNRYGNISFSQIKHMVSWFKSNPRAIRRTGTGKTRPKKRQIRFISNIAGTAGVSYFIAGNVIAKRRDKKASALMAIVSAPRYRERFPMDELVGKQVDATFNDNFIKALEGAIATAR